MKDIDFDELDRAVNSLMSTAAKDEPASGDSERATSPENANAPSLAKDSEPHRRDAETGNEATPPLGDTALANIVPDSVDSVSDQSPQEENDKPAEQESPAAPKVSSRPSTARRGRFMDVVRPGAEVSRRPSSAPVSRQGITLQPSGASQPETASTPEEKPPKSEPSPAEAMPDFESVTPDASIEPTTNTEPAAQESAPEPEENEETAPLTSPFLADAKVEKRPLGRPSDAVPPLADLAAELAKSTGESPAEQPPDTTAQSAQSDNPPKEDDAQLPEQPLPAELGSELLSIESDAGNMPETQPVVPAAATAPETVETPAATIDADNTPAAATPTPTVPSQSSAQAIAAASIPQQYKVQSGPADEAPVGAIYDVRPLIHAAEKKPGWLLVVAIIAILLLGAAGGAAVYYLGLL